MFLKNTPGLLTTKITQHQPRSALVARPHLLAQLDEGLEFKLTLVSAPAGSGKTTLLHEWIQHRKKAAHPPFRCAWLSLDVGDDDFHSFWRYVITACQSLHPSLGEKTLALLSLDEQAPIDVILSSFINEIVGITESWVLILDNYHAISLSKIHNSVAFLLDHLPAAAHLVLSTRSDLPPPLLRLWISNAIYEIRGDQLRFSKEETASFLRLMTNKRIPADVIDKLEPSTEGWITGVQFAALVMQEQADQHIQTIPAAFTGKHHYIVNYLLQEVLAQQPEHIQTFLLETALLGNVTDSLCDVVTGRRDSKYLLTQIERGNLFLSRLDEQWYRYHTLFAEAMHTLAYQRFGEERVSNLYCKACEWYEQHEFVTEAVEATLAASNYTKAASLIEHIFDHLGYYQYVRTGFNTWCRWIERLPKDLHTSHAAVCLIYAISLLFAGKGHESREQLKTAEQLCSAQGDLFRLGEVFTLRAVLEQWWYGNTTNALRLAQQALTLLPDNDTAWRGICFYVLGTEYEQTGDVLTAREHLVLGRALCEVDGNNIILDSTAVLGNILALQGKLHQAAQAYQQVLTTEHKQEILRVRASIGMGSLHLEWNDLEQADTYLSTLLKLDPQKELRLYALPGFLTLAHLRRAQGNKEAALEITLYANALAQSYDRADMIAKSLAFRARTALLEGDIQAAQDWWYTCNLPLHATPSFDKEEAYLIAARMLIAQRKPELALQVLKPWLEHARVQERSTSEIEIGVLCALAAQALGNEEYALHLLLHTLEIAQTEGYRRIFLEEGPPMAALLQTILKKGVSLELAEYVSRILQEEQSIQFPSSAFPGLPPASDFTSSLSRRELSILRLLVDGLSNKEIAEQETVSINTIKTQLKSIYRKLKVSNRKEAIRIARRSARIPPSSLRAE